MSKSRRDRRGGIINDTPFNAALKSDNRRLRHWNRTYTRAITRTPTLWEDTVPKILREVSNPWDYD